MVRFIDEHRGKFGVEPICAVLPIAPSLYHERKARDRDPHRRPARTRRDESLGEHVGRVWRENREVYGVRKVWKQLRREGQAVARCTVARLMRRLGQAGGGARADVRGDDDPGYRGGPTAGSGDATVQGRAAEPAVGRRSDVRRHVARVRVRGVRHRRVLASDRRLAGVDLAAQRPGPRCAGAGTLPIAPSSRRSRWCITAIGGCKASAKLIRRTTPMGPRSNGRAVSGRLQ